jgi:preprotein translocase subunit SecD
VEFTTDFQMNQKMMKGKQMKFQKVLATLSMVLFFAVSAFAAGAGSALVYVESAQPSNNSIEISYFSGPGGKLIVDRVPQMEVTKDDIDQAKIEPPGAGSISGFLAVTLTKDAAEKLASITRQNIGKRLVIVVDGAVVAAPIINAAIEGGWIRFIVPEGNPNDFLKKVPWLKGMAVSD